MNKLTKNLLGLMMLLVSFVTYAQTVISGKVSDEAKEPVIGANISIKGTSEGTITDIDGNFELSTEQSTPFTIVVTMVGMENVEKEITGSTSGLDIGMKEEHNILNTVVVSASRVEEKILESPVTIEKMDQKMVKQSSSNDYYDDLSKLKGVQVINGSMNLTSVNTRGFGGISNTRFVQLMDGMDNAAPLLNFPTGNIVGIGELDVQNVELVPGAASALYGPNAFNGILLMNSKNPFDSPGFSAQVKGGFASASNGYGTKPLGSVAMRVGHVWKRKGQDYVAIKFNANAFQGTDWYANDMSTRDDNGPIGAPNYDGMNVYGDETPIQVPYGGIRGNLIASTSGSLQNNPAFVSAVTAGVTAQVTAAVTQQVNANRPAIEAGVTAVVRQNAYDQAIANGADAATANMMADTYISSQDGITMIQTQTNLKIQQLIQQNVDAVLPGQIATNLPIQATNTATSKIDSISSLLNLDVRRTGLGEHKLYDAINDKNKATSFKGDVGIYYRPFKDKSYEFSYNYRIGFGNSVYQGTDRYALRNFTQQFHKAEIKGKDFFIRSYLSQTNAGKSYNLTALGSYTNEGISGTKAVWAPTYIANYAGVLIQNSILTSAANTLANAETLVAQAHQIARAAADKPWNDLTPEQQQALINNVRNGLFQQGGAGFIDHSRLFHTEGMVDLSRWTNKIVDIQIGGNHRMYSLFTNGTIFNEDPDGTGHFKRINIQEYGAFLQLKRKLFKDALTLQGSIRFDKNQNFKGIWSPRIAAVLSVGKDKMHNIRMSYQTGFRNPDTQAQYIYFPVASILLGGTEANAGRYGIYNGGAWTMDSYKARQQALLSGKSLAYADSLLVTSDIGYVKPERLQAIELGYKAMFAKKFMIDINGYFNIYDDFIGQIFVVNKDTAYHKGQAIAPGTTWYPYTNVASKVYSYGAGIGASYVLPKNMLLKASYNWMDYTISKANASGGSDEDLGFNAANHQFYIGISGDKVWKGLGFSVDYRWQSKINYLSSFASGIVKSRGILDANISYNIDKIYTQVKVGATNIAGPNYFSNIGGPLIGRTFYVGLTFDQGKQWRENSRRIETEGNTSF